MNETDRLAETTRREDRDDTRNSANDRRDERERKQTIRLEAARIIMRMEDNAEARRGTMNQRPGLKYLIEDADTLADWVMNGKQPEPSKVEQVREAMAESRRNPEDYPKGAPFTGLPPEPFFERRTSAFRSGMDLVGDNRPEWIEWDGARSATPGFPDGTIVECEYQDRYGTWRGEPGSMNWMYVRRYRVVESQPGDKSLGQIMRDIDAEFAQDLIDGFRAHAGGECPVDFKAIVEVRLRNGRKITERLPANAYSWIWRTPPHEGDILAYRVVPMFDDGPGAA
jgi:hypothetical protein